MKKICVVTGSRSEYGLLSRLIKMLEAHESFRLHLVVTGSHLSKEFGLTVNEIVADGIRVDQRIDIEIAGQSSMEITTSIGKGVVAFADYFQSNKPDLLLVMGDRYEMVAVALASFMANIPIVHISGGELSLGSKDDVLRHVITKLSSLHFVSAEQHRKRVIQLGEDPETVFKVGEPGLDDLHEIELLSRDTLEGLVGRKLDRKFFLMTFHPSGVNSKDERAENDVKPLLQSLDQFSDRLVLCCLPNSDVGGDAIRGDLLAYERVNSDRFHLYGSHGRAAFLSLVALSELVIGNSSSTLVEVPMLGVPGVDVGNRQRGRLRGLSVVHARNETGEIVKAINYATSNVQKKIAGKRVSLYGDGYACERIMTILEGLKLEEIGKRDFYDVDFVLPSLKS